MSIKCPKDLNSGNNACIRDNLWTKKYLQRQNMYNTFSNKEFLYQCHNCMNRPKYIFLIYYTQDIEKLACLM